MFGQTYTWSNCSDGPTVPNLRRANSAIGTSIETSMNEDAQSDPKRSRTHPSGCGKQFHYGNSYTTRP